MKCEQCGEPLNILKEWFCTFYGFQIQVFCSEKCKDLFEGVKEDKEILEELKKKKIKFQVMNGEDYPRIYTLEGKIIWG